MTNDEFLNELSKINIIPTNEQLDKLNKYYKLLINWNEKINLTSITKKEDVYLKHFYDSLTLSKVYNFNEKVKVCDVGTGAGFPGIVLKIMFPNIDLTLVEPLLKRNIFLNEVVNNLNLTDVKLVNKRAEDYFKNNREIFDVITTRAVSKLNIISELCIAGLKVNGLFIPMKANIDDEIKDICFLGKLSCEIVKIESFNLPIENSVRNLIVIKKLNKTNNIYPRMFDKIKKKPL